MMYFFYRKSFNKAGYAAYVEDIKPTERAGESRLPKIIKIVELPEDQHHLPIADLEALYPLEAAEPQRPKLVNPVVLGNRWKHRNGSLYTIIATGFIESDVTPAVIYQADHDGLVWVRPLDEFMDGRFTEITAA